MPAPRDILVTAFEPSGDALAARLIAELKRREPDRTIHALGGPKMRAAGAELIETTTEHGVMLVAGALAQANAHRKRMKRLAAWMADHELAAVVPTDSPAANWSVCKLTRKLHPDAKVVHLAAPQLWAWASWRIKKMRRLSDHVLCLLPFEREWFGSRGVPATFVGHPLFEAGDVEPLDVHAGAPTDAPKLALLPGSRTAEVMRNWPTMRRVLEKLRERHADLRAVVAASDDARAALLGTLPEKVEVVTGQTDAALAWSDAALAVSGTVTLQVAVRQRPMVVLFNLNRWSWTLVGQFLIDTRTFALPNLITESQGWGRLVPEFVPHFGAAGPLVEALDPLLSPGPARDAQLAGFERIHGLFGAVSFARTAADALLAAIE